MRINIIGAGITGLSAAYFLTQKGHEVKIFDCKPEVGGLASSFYIEGTYLEKYYHHSFTGHIELIELVKELNIEKGLFSRRVRMGFFYEGRLYPFVTARDLLLFNPLRLRNRIRLGLTSFVMMRIKDWHNLEKRSALEWLRSYSGGEVCKIIWEPLLRMKFGDDYDCISAAWLWNRVVDRKGSNARRGGKDVLWYVKGGYKSLFDALIKSIESRRGKIYTDTPVEQICVKDGKSLGVDISSRFFESDIVLSTVPIPQFLHIAPFLPEQYANSLKAIKYQGSTCLVLKLKKALSVYYWINVSDPDSPFVGIIEHTNLISPEHYGNRHIVYLTKYSSSNDSIFSRSHESIYRNFVTYLKRIFPKLSENDVEGYWVFQDRFSQPVFVKNYSQIMPDTLTPIENLYLLNTAQTYPQSRSINSSIAKAHDLASGMLNKNNGR